MSRMFVGLPRLQDRAMLSHPAKTKAVIAALEKDLPRASYYIRGGPDLVDERDQRAVIDALAYE